jgi:glycosyltransferase involved in cell wall biosynthesis
MTLGSFDARGDPWSRAKLTTDIVVPVHNEEHTLRASIASLLDFLAGTTFFDASIVIADNASTDGTLAVARELEREQPRVHALQVPSRGRGGALKAAWSASRADVVSYMDVDLSTNLRFFPLLIHGIALGYDVAIGSRLLQASQTRRSLKREILSRTYNRLVKLMFRNRFSDAQCGFKALRADVARDLLAHVEDTDWFFDTELLLQAERRGYKIFEVPVEWIEDLDSRVRIMRTAFDDVRGLIRVRMGELGRLRSASRPRGRAARSS